VLLDDAGGLREHEQFDNLQDSDNKERLIELLKRRKPNVIVLGGFTIHTTKLAQQLKEVLRGPPPGATGWDEGVARLEHSIDTPIVHVQDEVARIYQHSKRAHEEFSALPLTPKYCVGLARYTQSPLNEFAALGSDITAIMPDEEAQQLVSRRPPWLEVGNDPD
jgi:transcription elongation factor SPT6